MFWIALAAQISAPVPENGGSWFSPQDVPQFLLRQGTGLWFVHVRVAVTPEGRIQSCDVERTGGISDLNKLTCRIVLKRAKFKPALIDDVPVYGVYRSSVRWETADTDRDTSKIHDPDLDVTVERLPGGVESPALVGVYFIVDAHGNKSSCVGAETKEIKHAAEDTLLTSVACEQVMQNYPAVPAVDGKEQPVESVQSALVRFSGPTSK